VWPAGYQLAFRADAVYEVNQSINEQILPASKVVCCSKAAAPCFKTYAMKLIIETTQSGRYWDWWVYTDEVPSTLWASCVNECESQTEALNDALQSALRYMKDSQTLSIPQEFSEHYREILQPSAPATGDRWVNPDENS
jgi:hypothetical protein